MIGMTTLCSLSETKSISGIKLKIINGTLLL
jgi:hypothetical protein